MNHTECPVCKRPADWSKEGDFGDRRQIRCTRCGPFLVTGTALEMLDSRLKGDKRAFARLSHAIRSMTSDESWVEITSTNLDNLLSQPLPPVSDQLLYLLAWLKGKAGDHYLGSIAIGDVEQLTAVLGTVDGESVYPLLGYAAQEGWIKYDAFQGIISLTPKAWQNSAAEKGEKNEMASPTRSTEQNEEILEGHCPNCGGKRNANVVAEYKDRWEHDEAPIWSLDIYRVLKCRGCEAVYVQREYLFSEDETPALNPQTGEWEPMIPSKVMHWPAPSTRSPPGWLHQIGDETVRILLVEIYDALDADLRSLAAMGTRAVLDRAMELSGATADDGFEQKLKTLKIKGVISQHEKDILLIMTDAGSAASHRGWRPDFNTMNTILDATEAFLQRAFVLSDAAAEVKKSVPPRRKKRGTK